LFFALAYLRVFTNAECEDLKKRSNRPRFPAAILNESRAMSAGRSGDEVFVLHVPAVSFLV